MATLLANLWWLLPSIVMLSSIGTALFMPTSITGILGVLAILPRLICALFFSMLAWAIGAIFK